MEDALLLVIGGALTVVGGFFQHLWADRRQQKYWGRELSEKRLIDAATSLAALENLLTRRHLVSLIQAPPLDKLQQSLEDLTKLHENWVVLSDDIRRIGILNRALAADVDRILVKSGDVFRLTAETYGLVSHPESGNENRVELAEEHREESVSLIRALEDRLASS